MAGLDTIGLEYPQEILLGIRMKGKSQDLAIAKENFMRSKFFISTIVILAVALALFGSIFLLKPFPTGNVNLATSYAGSAWEAAGKRAIPLLEQHGIKLNIVETGGASQNIQLLSDKKSEVNAALLFEALLSEDLNDKIYSLASVGYSPVWIFYRETGKGAPVNIGDLAQQKVAIGPKHSGSYALTKKLFGLQGIDVDESPNFISSPFKEGLSSYLAGKADVIIFTGDHDDPVVKKLFFNPGTKIFQMQTEALVHQKKGFNMVRLPAGIIDIDKSIPEKDVNLLSTTTILAVKKSMQPGLQLGLLMAASKVVKETPYSYTQIRIEFPAPAYNSPLGVSPTAKEYFANGGPPLLTKFFPTWLAYFPL